MGGVCEAKLSKINGAEAPMFMARIGLIEILDFMYTKTKPAPEPIITAVMIQ